MVKNITKYSAIIIVMLIVISGLLYYYFSLSGDKVANTTEAVYQKLGKKYDLDQNLTFYEDTNNGTLTYDKSTNRLMITLPGSIVQGSQISPDNELAEIIRIENQVMQYLDIKLDDYCFLDITLVSNQGNTMKSIVCHYEG